MITVHIIHGDATLRFAARRILEPAGFVVSEAADETRGPPSSPHLVIAEAADIPAIARRFPAAGVIPLSGADGLGTPFTASRLLAAVRLCLARMEPSVSGATKGSRRRSARRRPRRV